ncbi:MAG: PAS-domain containing protein [Pseudomonadota bacterium]
MSLINPADPLERQNAKLIQIAESLMRRVEQAGQDTSLAYSQFERAATLEAQVRARTLDLERTLDLLHESNARLAEATQEAEAARSDLADAIETVDEGFALFGADNRLVLSNSRFCKDLLDIGPDLMPGLGFSDYVEMISQSRFLALPEGESPAEWAQNRLARHQDEHVVFNVRLIWDRWLQVSEHRTAAGGTVILQTDVTDIMRVERRARDKLLHEQTRMVRATLDHLNQGVCIFARDATLVGWNTKLAELLDLPEQSTAPGLGFAALLDRLGPQVSFDPRFGRDRLRDWAAQRRRRKPIAFELVSGAGRTLAVFAQEMPDRGFVISFTDVSAERAAARALVDANEMLERRVEERTLELEEALSAATRANATKTRFVAAASHDLLQPLSAAKLFVSALEDGAADGRQRDTAGKAISALASLEVIIEALLDISKLDSGQAGFAVGPVRLSALFSSLRDEMTPLAAAQGLDLRIVDSSLTVDSDPGYLRRIVQNLISNAIRYTPEGRVSVGVRRKGGAARLQVWDTGIGIAPEHQEAIFQEFRQVDPGGPGGLGLGLAIVERACTGLRHRLNLWSEPGRGSCFSVDLAVSELHPALPMARARAVPDGPCCRGLVVLLVENDMQLARALTQMVEGWGAEVIQADTAEQALELLDLIDLQPDAVLLDQQLGPGMPGTALYRALRTRFGPVPARIVTANRSVELQRLCAKLDVAILPKPIDRDRLLGFLRTAAQDGLPA